MPILKNPVLWLLLMLSSACRPSIDQWAKETAPQTFDVRFETSKGNFDVHVERQRSPHGADRFYQLVKHKYLNDVLFYRVDSNFVAQFGLSDSTSVAEWAKNKVPDDPVIYGNKKGTLSFARGKPETRSSDLFINLNDNPHLDTIFYDSVRGFPAFGNVTSGMEVVESLFAGYGDRTMTLPDSIMQNQKRVLQLFPDLDKIKKAYLLN